MDEMKRHSLANQLDFNVW